MDALSIHEVIATIFTIIQVELDTLDRLRQAVEEDAAYNKLIDLV